MEKFVITQQSRDNMDGSHICIVDPDSICYVGYMRVRKLALCEGQCKECGGEIFRAFDLIHIDAGCEEGCCGSEGCTANPDSIGPSQGDNHHLVWSCINCDCWGVVGDGSGVVYEDDEASVEFWSGGLFKTQ